ncbi:DUF983 domain-containing protein [Paracoccus sp. 11-3]|uniref:DUF983 domain-containing protein n=1 Tax=Paracoccus amoyensis TaxID=2760093 RepID=A0A926JCC0_9RHOB|nr:DUF983 domain-containing protein [Paracoccus amoyensis]MBC9245633.1 DUF983 domain-containing protein [Paracoccus amoyensis]
MLQSTSISDQIERPTGRAMWRGTRGRCPSCGEGKMFRSYLKVSDECPVCGEELHHQRADDGPAYLTILIVSHLAAPMLLAYFIAFRPSAITMITVFGIGTIISSLLLLPLIKGAFVGFQWARRMHGFDHAEVKN